MEETQADAHGLEQADDALHKRAVVCVADRADGLDDASRARCLVKRTDVYPATLRRGGA